jgi:RNA polymerase sigma-70 factor (ECF subfamily)
MLTPAEMAQIQELDHQRVVLALQGDHDAFAELVNHYQRAVYGLTLRMLGDAAEAEDAAQETFLRAYRHLEKYDAARPFRTWLLSIASHYCIDLIRKRRISLLSLDEFLPPHWLFSGEDSVEDAAISSERRDYLQTMLERLRPDERAIIILRYWHDMPYEEIADILGTNRGVVKSRLFRARQALANQMHVHSFSQRLSPMLN